MKLISVKLKNFRCYREEFKINFSNLTTIIGKNDIGKSTILEALDIFFEKGIVRLDSNDVHISANGKIVEIECEFTDLPETIVLDDNAPTTLGSEYLLTKDGNLKIKKRYDCNLKSPKCEVFIYAYHPSKVGIDSLLQLKERELQNLIKEYGLETKLKGNPNMREAIWSAQANLELKERYISISNGKENEKRVWEQLQKYLPIFALFQSDRNSQDSDNEVQNPMKVAIHAAIEEVRNDIEKIQCKVKEKAEEIARLTHQALQEIDPKIAETLEPEFISFAHAKLANLFSLSLKTDDGIGLNKRGSGVRRLVLVSFFKAEAERQLTIGNRNNIIYAIEEPETAQHPNNQKILIESFKKLSEKANCQVILTTHCPGLASELPTECICFISRNENGNPKSEPQASIFETVGKMLGVIPDNPVKAFICVEGKTDIIALKCLSKALHNEDKTIINLDETKDIVFIPLGGSTLNDWVSQHYLKILKKPEIHIYDGDQREKNTTKITCNLVNERGDGSWAKFTKKHTIEHYLPFDLICNIYDINNSEQIVIEETQCLAKQLESKLKYKNNILENANTIKKSFATYAFPAIKAEHIKKHDPDGEIEGWLREIQKTIERKSAY